VRGGEGKHWGILKVMVEDGEGCSGMEWNGKVVVG